MSELLTRIPLPISFTAAFLPETPVSTLAARLHSESASKGGSHLFPRPRTGGLSLLAAALILLLLPLAGPVTGQESSGLAGQERGVVAEDYYRMVFVDDVAISPTGDRVALTVTRISEEENRRSRRIWMVHLADGAPVDDPVPFTDPTRDAWDPRWSPDGALLAFQSRRDDETGTWFLRTDGRGGEAFQIPGVEGTPIWSPDGEWIAYTSRPEGEEGERVGWIAPDARTETADPERFDGRVITHPRYKSDGTHSLLPHPGAMPRTQLYLVPATGGDPRQLTELAFDVGAPVWAPDGDRLFFAANEVAHEDPYERRSDLFRVERESGEVVRLTPGEGIYSVPAVSPEGSRMAFLFSEGQGELTQVLVSPLSSEGDLEGIPGENRGGAGGPGSSAEGPGFSPGVLTEGWDLSPGAPRWRADGQAVRFETAASGNRHLYEVELEGLEPRRGRSGDQVERVTEGDRQLSSFSESSDGAWMAYVATDAVRPGEVFLADGGGRGEGRLTDFNDEWLAEVRLEAPERITWNVADGTQVEGWVIPPVGVGAAAAEASRPMVLKIHGGPHSMYGNTFFQTFHVLSAAGFFVFYPNPRGSSGYGHDFTFATRGGWGLVDEEDFLTGLDAVLERYPAIDPERVGVSGGSYGGYAANWLTARSDRFAAAVTSRSIVSLETLLGTSDALGTLEFEFFGTPWEERERYRAASPWSYVEKVTAPTLIIHSELDHRTPMQDAEMWFRALTLLDVPVEFVRYPRSSHGLSRTGEPWLLVDRMVRLRSWFEYWLGEG